MTLTNWRNPPFARWAFQLVRELVPSTDIARDPANVARWHQRPSTSASPLPEVFRDLSVDRLLAFGALMMVIMIVRPQGLLPEGGAQENCRTTHAGALNSWPAAPKTRYKWTQW